MNVENEKNSKYEKIQKDKAISKNTSYYPDLIKRINVFAKNEKVTFSRVVQIAVDKYLKERGF